jgi:protein-S-isoprenylcysteine O-methyltransferase
MSRALILLGLPVHAWFGFLLLEYHVSEIVLVLLIEPEEFSRESFLVTHAYLCAMACGLAEYLIGFSAFPGYKLATCGLLSAPGLVGAIAGEALRKAAWLTARSSFTHKIQQHKRPGHVLVTHGIYGIMRHPGYFGWTVWAIGTQLLLGNIVSPMLFAAASYRFFSVRIPYEEQHLERLFGTSYVRYKVQVGTWMGFP